MPSAMAFDQTPNQPPDVAAQMGAKPAFAGVGEMMAGKKPESGPGGVSPTGAIESAGEAVEKVIDNMATMSEAFKPFANRIKQFLKAGIAEARKSGQPGSAPQGPPAVSAKPPQGEEGITFPG